MSHITLTTPLKCQFVFRWLVLATIHLHTKLEVSSFIRSGDMSGSQIQNVGHVTLTMPPFRPIMFTLKIAFGALLSKFHASSLAVCQVNGDCNVPRKFGTAHATVARDLFVRGQNNYTLVFGIPVPDLPIHYTTIVGLRRRLRVVHSRAALLLSGFSVGRKFSQVPFKGVGLDQRSYSASDPVSAWVGDCFRTGKPPGHRTRHSA